MSDKFPHDNAPEGCKHLYGALFTVPFGSIVVPDADPDGEFKFSNPRLNTERGAADLIDKRLSAELRDSIKSKTLLNPLVCRWIQKDGKNFPQLVGGDRRYRAISFLIHKKEIVTDPRSMHLNDDGEWDYKQVPANEAYALIPCQIFAVSNDLEALALAWAENKGRINLTEGHEIAEVRKLRQINASDEKILEILQQDEKWLQETDNLLANLDADTLADLLESRMTRACAIELSTVVDIELRSQIRIKANEAAIETCQRKVKRIQKQIESALDEREIAEGAVADAEFHDDETAVKVAEGAVEEATKKVKRHVKERDGEAPVATAKQVKDAKEEADPGNVIPTPRMLRAAKVQDGLQYLDNLIANGGKDLEDPPAFVADLNTLMGMRRVLNNNILANEADFRITVKRHVEAIGQQIVDLIRMR